VSCEKFAEKMDAYLDCLLSDRELAEFQEHLSACTACRQEAAELESMLSWLKQAGAVTPPTDLRKSVLLELKKEQSRKGGRFFPGFSQAVAAAVVLIMLIVVNLSPLPPAPFSDAVPMRATYQEESGAATPPADARIYTQELSDNLQVRENSELSYKAEGDQFPKRLVLNLVLVPLFLFFSLRVISLRVIQKRKEADRGSE